MLYLKKISIIKENRFSKDFRLTSFSILLTTLKTDRNATVNQTLSYLLT